MKQYPLTSELEKRLENDYTYHAPHSEQQERYVLLRSECLRLALLIAQCTPASREQSLALTHLEEVNMYANAAIARNEYKQ